MKNKFAWIHCLNRVAAAITKEIHHDFNLTKQETTQLKREVSWMKWWENGCISEFRYIVMLEKQWIRTKHNLNVTEVIWKKGN